MSGGEWNTSRERKQLAADARELEREQIRLAKRMLRDLRWSAERSTLRKSDWADLLTLHQAHGKEGLNQLWLELVPYWCQCQLLNGGTPCPPDLRPAWLKLSAEKTRTKPTTRKAPGAPRKTRADKGQARSDYTPRKPKAPK